MSELAGQRVVVMGLGVNGGGLGVTRFLVEQGATVLVTDLRSAEILAPTLQALDGLPVEYVLGEHRVADFERADIVIRNPGVPRESKFLAVARAAGARIEMEMTLFFRLCPGPIIGITGTRGKTTTTMLCHAMIREQFPDAVVAGNLRVSALEQLPQLTPTTPVVLELSSWQLEGLGEAGLSPQYACATNLSPDHLDRYGSMDDYAAAKRAIVEHQPAGSVAVLNADDPVISAFAAHTGAEIVWFGTADSAQVQVRPDGVWSQLGPTPVKLCNPAEVQIPGQHNLMNIAAASALALRCGVSAAQVSAAIRGFSGVADRLELVRELHGVRYINDTTATTPTALIAALGALTAPVILIAGGADKKLPFDGLAAAVAARAKAVVVLAGTGTARLVAELATAAVPLTAPFTEFAAAVAHAQSLAAPGDVVLLSPGCASFGMFTNEFDRGEQFRSWWER